MLILPTYSFTFYLNSAFKPAAIMARAGKNAVKQA